MLEFSKQVVKWGLIFYVSSNVGGCGANLNNQEKSLINQLTDIQNQEQLVEIIPNDFEFAFFATNSGVVSFPQKELDKAELIDAGIVITTETTNKFIEDRNNLIAELSKLNIEITADLRTKKIDQGKINLVIFEINDRMSTQKTSITIQQNFFPYLTTTDYTDQIPLPEVLDPKLYNELYLKLEALSKLNSFLFESSELINENDFERMNISTSFGEEIDLEQAHNNQSVIIGEVYENNLTDELKQVVAVIKTQNNQVLVLYRSLIYKKNIFQLEKSSATYGELRPLTPISAL